MPWLSDGNEPLNNREEQGRNKFLHAQEASCRNTSVKVGEDVFGGLDVIKGVRHVKTYGDDWEMKTGIVFIDGQKYPVWQDEKWSHWELDPGEIHAKKAAKADFHYEI